MIRKLIVLLTVLLVASTAYAEPLNGQDYLALLHPQFRVDLAVAFLPQGTPTGHLDTTFGTDLSHLRLLLGSVHPKYHRVYLCNGPGIRNSQSGSYEIGHGYSKASFSAAIEKRDPKILKYFTDRTVVYRDVSALYPDTTFIIAPCLEHDLSIAAFRILVDTVLAAWPGVQIDNVPDGGIPVERYKGAWIERHGNKPQADADINSLDGADASDIGISAWLKNSLRVKIRYVWSRIFNCRNQSATFVDPRARGASCPKKYHFEELAHITEVITATAKWSGGKVCKVTKVFANPWIWKPFSKDTGNKDPRANLPCLITLLSGKVVNVLAANGKSVGKLGYFGTFTGGLFRWYSGWAGGDGRNGYTYQKNAQAIAGQPYVWLQDEKQNCVGPIVPGRRQGLVK